MASLWQAIRGSAVPSGVLGSWIGLLSYGIQIYFDFSGYSDMAIGLGRMFGFEFLKNFDYPYISESISEFWRRWHISLSTWFKEYVYIPLGGNRKGKARQLLNLLIVWSLTGLWHGASWNFVLWGLFYGIVIVLERLFLGKVLKKIPSFFRHLYTLLLVTFGWALFDFTKTSDFIAYMGTMFTLKNGVISHDVLMQFLSYLPLMIVAVLGATPFFAKLRHRFDDKPWAEWVDIALVLIALTLCVASLVASGYNPFIYFRF